MSLEIIDVFGRGDASHEFVHLRANEACQLDFFMLADSTYCGPGRMSNKLRHHYWWAKDQQADAGDNIFVFTGSGIDGVKNKNGIISRYYFWNLKVPVWNDTGDTAVLFHLNGWSSKILPSGMLKLAA
jgi:hypothetical protein